MDRARDPVEFGALFGGAVRSIELKVLCALPIRSVMEELGPKFECASPHKLVTMFASLGAVLRHVEDGGPVDVVLAPRQALERLVSDGKVADDEVAVIARARIGLAVCKQAPRPDISSVDSLRRALLAAKAITYSHPSWGGVSGAHVERALDRLGIADEMKTRTVFAQSPGGDGLGALLASGEAEIAAHQIQELVRVPGVEIIGPLPDDLQEPIEFSAGAAVGTAFPEAVRSLIAFLFTQEAAAVIRAKGMEPVSSTGA